MLTKSDKIMVNNTIMLKIIMEEETISTIKKIKWTKDSLVNYISTNLRYNFLVIIMSLNTKVKSRIILTINTIRRAQLLILRINLLILISKFKIKIISTNFKALILLHLLFRRCHIHLNLTLSTHLLLMRLLILMPLLVTLIMISIKIYWCTCLTHLTTQIIFWGH